MSRYIDTLTDIGVSNRINVQGFKNHTVSVRIRDIGDLVLFNLQGCISDPSDDDNWFDLKFTEISARTNGSHGFIFDGCLDFIRLNYSDKDGGVNTTLEIRYTGGQ